MISGRLRECLKTLRWSAADLAEQLGSSESEVTTWLDGRDVAPIAVAAWLEALVKAYKALPPPSLRKAESTPVNEPIKVTDVDIVTRTITHPGLDGVMMQSAYPRRIASTTGARPALIPGLRKGVLNHATHPL
ncbi:helix-turn-helix transcriptional regulator [Aquamicrobium sp. LC103]|uniref:helix-turn-helix domain-containing protein n=1 Tax=Aquamicrobium sp. LC103 TaxID=1120658 RepID=UPI000A8C7330|nr:helix-turn-helix transcriptional regulator [Aquamicrobium sp. LC103]TKT75824.1 helix-turn-helix domain-containing protein [Aquamicrobium sp. LC103]